MKKCPNCTQVFPDDDLYCPDDGAALVAGDDRSSSRIFVDLDDQQSSPETETQIVAAVPIGEVAQPQRSPALLYAALGALGAIVLLLGGYVVLDIGSNRNSSTGSVNQAAVQSPSPLPGSDGIVSPGPTRSYTSVATANANANANSNFAANPIRPVEHAVNTVANAVNAWTNASRPDQSRRFDRTYSGTVDNGYVVMRLNRNGGRISGEVMPGGRRSQIYVDGYVGNDGSFEMSEKSDIGVVTGVYRGRLNSDGTMSGYWSKPEGGKTRAVAMRRQ